ncbi:transcriptional repressor LexA [Streptomyces sp. RKAG337]|uniref:transcriptional repressor LexA n=1 Tax=Streptomyces sp. RKAG337 TaxID=2893404 RepID=UPI0020342B2F|nr:transcriptional repressor LexA [Streptomyces sp. RKAG337]MCM2431075.1 transcriptional repressor LexA [Streptomyces sp. RKAG337]
MEATTTGNRPGRPPGIRTLDNGLTDRQQRIVAAIRTHLDTRGYPPSMREIGSAVGLASTSSVAHQLEALERKGALRKDPHRPRAYVPTGPNPQTSPDPQPTPTVALPADASTAVRVPLVGRIAAGTPMLAEQHIDDILVLPRQVVGSGNLFVLTVTGESMIDAHIADGDHVVVREQPSAENGDIVAAMLDGNATVKRLKRDGNNVWLLPANDSYQPIWGNEATILGKVVAVMRSL